MRALLIVVLLSACAGGATPENKANFQTVPGDGQLTISGSAGSGFTEAEINSRFLRPTCAEADMTLSSAKITPNPDGSIEFTAICK